MHRRKTYEDRLGRQYPEIIKRNPGGRRKATPTPSPPSPSPRRSKVTLTIAITAAAAAVAGVTINASVDRSAGSGGSLTVQVKLDLNYIIAALAKLGFHSTDVTNSSSPSYDKDCAKSATLGVKKFLTQYPCKEYASTITTVRKGNTTTHVVITRVTMPTPGLASKYETEADAPGSGNPPGESPAFFNGYCYASGRNGATVWTEQVQPTGNRGEDQAILQAAALTKLTPHYLGVHCTE